MQSTGFRSYAGLRGSNVFREEMRYLSAGDRIQWRFVNRELGLKNAERGTVEPIEEVSRPSHRIAMRKPRVSTFRAHGLGSRICRACLLRAVEGLMTGLRPCPDRIPIRYRQNY